ncbi:hypothetical protein AKO1_006358 [Acrasis kona]|uniref:Integral membrane protein n=1 Tax=Acrasis kona TaxID=1008807 RepID=A0AAW2YHS5_9EUKA
MAFVTIGGLITLFLAVAMLFTGTLNTLFTKYQDMRVVKGVGHFPPSPFEHPFFQTACMFVGEFACLFIYLLTTTALFKSCSAAIQSKFVKKVPETEVLDVVTTTTYVGDAAVSETTVHKTDERMSLLLKEQETKEKQARYTNPLLFAIPSVCDLLGTTLMNVGLFYTDASVYQMLRGILVVFNAILAIIFLKQKLYPHHFIGIILIVIGTGLVGLSSYLYKSDSSHAARNPVLGNALVIAAQLIAAVMMITEEKILTNYPAQPLQVVGWEGFWGLSFVSIMLFVLYWIPGGDAGRVENSVHAFAQLGRDGKLLTAVLGSVCSIAFFNFFGISITQRVSATTRAAIDSCRTFFIWMVSLAIGWEKFNFLQLGGFIIVVTGTFLFNEVIRIPKYHAWYEAKKADDEERKAEKKLLKRRKI